MKDMAKIGNYLKGLRIAHLHLDIPDGQETKPILNALAKKYGFTVRHFPADNDRTKSPYETSSIYAGLTASRWNLQ